MFLIVVLTLIFGRPFAEFEGAGWTTTELLKMMGLVVVIKALVNVAWLAIAPKRPVSNDWKTMIQKGWGTLILIVVVIGPVLEELVFRYLLVGGLYDVSPVLAILMSGLLFGLVHSRAPVLKILMGSLYAWIYIQSGSLWVPMALHMTWNAGVLFIARNDINKRIANRWEV